MSSRITRVAATVVALTAGAAALSASPALARGGNGDRARDGAGQQRPGQDRERPRAPRAPGAVQPGVGINLPDDGPDMPGQPRTAGPQRGPAAEPGDGTTRPRADAGDTWLPRGIRRGRSFRVGCDFVTSGMFDPIVFPGQNPAGHDHQFFGGLSISADSTPASLVAANADRDSTSCGHSRDGSAYWVPALQVVDNPANPVTLEPDEIRVRYAAPRGQRVRAFPAGFTAIAGDKAATEVQSHAGWRCEYDRRGTALAAQPPLCDTDEAIVGVVRFPNCWDGTNLSSATQDHIAYRKGRTCPDTHPVALPEMTQEVFWVPDGGQHQYALSSGSPAGLHADFMNGWDQRALNRQVRRWLNRRR
jgi:hypothetical protein